MAFLPGLLSALAPMLPGIVSTIGNIAGKVFNRAPGKGIGETLLEAAPEALQTIGGVAGALAPGLGGTAGRVLSGIGSVAGALAPTGPSPGQPLENYQAYQKSMEPYKIGDTRESDDNYTKAGELWFLANTKEFTDWANSNEITEADNNIRRIPGYYNEMVTAQTPADMRRVIAKWENIVRKPYGDSVTPWHEPAPPSLSATDHMPVMHGPPTQPVTSISGPLSLQGVSPAQAYQNDSTQQSPVQRYGPLQPPPTASELQLQRSLRPEDMQQRYRDTGFVSKAERTQAESNGSSPSFNIFDKLAPRPVEVIRNVVETLPPAASDDSRLARIEEILARRTVKRSVKKATKKAKKGGRK